MTTLWDAFTSLANGWWQWFWPVFWQIGVAVVVAGVFLRIAKGLSPNVHSWVWRVIHVKVLVLLVWPPSWTLSVLAPDVLQQFLVAPGFARDTVAADGGGLLRATPMWPLVLFCIWVGGVLVSSVRYWRGWRAFSALRAAAVEPASPHLDALIARVVERCRCRRGPVVLTVAGLSSPFVCGVRRATLILPRDFALDGRPLEAVLAHEIAHVRRCDIHWSIVMTAVGTLLWLQPLLWWARREAHAAGESACDEVALEATHIAPAEYGKALISVAARPTNPPSPDVVPALGATTALEHRLEALGREPAERSGWWRAAVFAFTVLLPLGLAPRPGQDGADEGALPRISLYRNQDGAILRIIVTPAPTGGLTALIERPNSGERSVFSVADLDELDRCDHDACEFIRSCVRQTEERSWLFM